MSDDNIKIQPHEVAVISDFQKELSTVINKHSRENMSDTPDFILAKFLEQCLLAYSIAVCDRDHWYGAKVVD